VIKICGVIEAGIVEDLKLNILDFPLEFTRMGSSRIVKVLAIVTMASSPPSMAIIVVVSWHGNRGGSRLDLFIIAHNFLVMCPIERMRMKVTMVMAYHLSAKSTLVPWTWMATMTRRAARVTMVTQTGLVLISNFIDQCW
jgi:hypothetical protein